MTEWLSKSARSWRKNWFSRAVRGVATPGTMAESTTDPTFALNNLKAANVEDDFMAALKQIETLSLEGCSVDKVQLLTVSKEAKKRAPGGWTKQVQLKYGAMLRRVYVDGAKAGPGGPGGPGGAGAGVESKTQRGESLRVKSAIVPASLQEFEQAETQDDVLKALDHVADAIRMSEEINLGQFTSAGKATKANLGDEWTADTAKRFGQVVLQVRAQSDGASHSGGGACARGGGGGARKWGWEEGGRPETVVENTRGSVYVLVFAVATDRSRVTNSKMSRSLIHTRTHTHTTHTNVPPASFPVPRTQLWQRRDYLRSRPCGPTRRPQRGPTPARTQGCWTGRPGSRSRSRSSRLRRTRATSSSARTALASSASRRATTSAGVRVGRSCAGRSRSRSSSSSRRRRQTRGS